MTASVAESATAVPHPGVRIELLRPGSKDEILFLAPGLEGDPTELAYTAAAFFGPQEVYAVAPALTEPVDGVDSVPELAALMAAAIRDVQPTGPYRLGGYSFGGLLVFEIAQQLRAAGETVAELFLIEAIYDERYWPRGIWLRALARRTLRQLTRIVRMPPGQAVRELSKRSRRLVQRFVRRNPGVSDALAPASPDASVAIRRAMAALSGYRPTRYDGTATVIASPLDRTFGCDTAQLWSICTTKLEIQRIEGDHLTVMQDPAGAAAVANIIDFRLGLGRPSWPGLRPTPGFERPLVVTTMRWFSSGRLAQSMIEAGFTVSACRPARHVFGLVAGLHSDSRMHRAWRQRSIRAAIRAADPDIVLADDERALGVLRRMYERAEHRDPKVRALLAKSLGQIEHWPAIVSRTGLAQLARALGVGMPATAVVADHAALTEWVGTHGYPVVLKTDGSWGGRGVAIAESAADLHGAWRSISRPPGLVRSVKRFVVNREVGPLAAWARRARPTVNAQAYVGGREAIATATCVDGKVQALVCLEVVAATEPRGPASVVKIIDQPAMAATAQRLIGQLGLSGFCGFDFKVTDDGGAHLLELNPRITPTAYMLVDGDFQSERSIVLFPPATDVAPVESATVDRPVRAPRLQRYGERMAARLRRAKATRRLTHKLRGTRF